MIGVRIREYLRFKYRLFGPYTCVFSSQVYGDQAELMAGFV